MVPVSPMAHLKADQMASKSRRTIWRRARYGIDCLLVYREFLSAMITVARFCECAHPLGGSQPSALETVLSVTTKLSMAIRPPRLLNMSGPGKHI